MSNTLRKWLLRVLLFGAALALLLWALRGVPLADIGRVLARLSAAQIALLILVNIGIVLLFGWRWWLILRAQGHPIPYLAITRYRLAAFGVSYFTPGPHFGGEPLQVYFLRHRHGVPGSTALAAVTLDKVVELLGNFAFLAIGLGVVLGSGIFLELDVSGGRAFFILLTLLPLAYLLALRWGARPMSALAAWLPARWGQALRATEDQLGLLTEDRPGLLLHTLLASLAVWAALLFEYWLALRFLGLALSAAQLIAVVVAARLAMLAPTPGALGALEAAQVFAMQALGLDPALGLSLSLLIRARDVLFGGLGLWLAGTSGRPAKA